MRRASISFATTTVRVGESAERLMRVPRSEAVVKSVIISRELERLVVEFCKRNNISFSRLVRALLVAVVTGEMNVSIVTTNHEINAASITIREKKEERLSARLRAERLCLEADKVIETANRHLNTPKYKRDMSWWNRQWRLQDRCKRLLEEIEKTSDKLTDPEVLDKLRERHRALTNLLYGELT